MHRDFCLGSCLSQLVLTVNLTQPRVSVEDFPDQLGLYACLGGVSLIANLRGPLSPLWSAACPRRWSRAELANREPAREPIKAFLHDFCVKFLFEFLP